MKRNENQKDKPTPTRIHTRKKEGCREVILKTLQREREEKEEQKKHGRK